MLKWFSNDEGGPGIAAPGSPQGDSWGGSGGQATLVEVSERLAQTEQLVTQLKELIREKDGALQAKDEQLKAFDTKLSKIRLQNKAKVTSLSSQLEELKQKQVGPNQDTPTHSRKGGSEGGEQASRGKILLLRKKVEELEHQLSKKEEELAVKICELKAQQQRGEDMDAMLMERDRKLGEKEAYIVHLQTSLSGEQPAAPSVTTTPALKSSEESKDLQELQILVQNLTKKVGDEEERYSLLHEHAEGLKVLLATEKAQYEEKENMYKQNIQTFKDIIQQKDNTLVEVNQMHEQELFKLAAKSDASSDLEQLLKALKQKLHEKEEVLLGKTQVIDVLQGEVDGRDQQIKDCVERARRLQVERESLQSKLEAEKHVMRAQLRDLMENHEAELRRVTDRHQAQLAEEQALRGEQRQTDASQTQRSDTPVDSVTAHRIAELEAHSKSKSEEASKSEAKFLKMKAWSKSRIRQLEEELRKSQSGGTAPDLTALHRRITDLEEEREEAVWKLEHYKEITAKNDLLEAKLTVYEEQQRTMQADLEQATKRAASQASESGSADDTQSQVLEWQEMVSDVGTARSRSRGEKAAMVLRINNMEEEREVLASQQQELEEELAQARGLEPHRGKKLGGSAQRSLEMDFEFDGQQSFQDPCNTSESTTPMEGENMGGWWPEYSTPNTEGLRSVVEELELERNQLQEQILALEERCQDLEDRLQLQARIESLQNESERLQGQLVSLRNQQSRDAEKHQLLVTSLNEQVKGLSDTQECLETSLIEKENRLANMSEKLELIDSLKDSLKEKDVQHKEVSDKLLQTEHNLTEVSKNCNAFEKQCSEMKTLVADLSLKLSDLKEKTQKQEATIETLQIDLDQTNDELDKINTTHLEERAQLIHDLQTCEREMDNLKEMLSEKEKEISVLSGNMVEYAEQITILKQEMNHKEEQLVLIESALTKSEREVQILRDSQDSDQQSLNTRMSELMELLTDKENELSQVKEERKLKDVEVNDLTKQVKEDKLTIQDLRREIQKNNVIHCNHLSECEVQILSLKEQVTLASQNLQDSNNLISQLKENNASSENLKDQLLDKEQTYENELKFFKEERNQLLAELEKHNKELQSLSKQLEDKSENISKLKMLLESMKTENLLLQTNLQGLAEELKSEQQHVHELSVEVKAAVEENISLKSQLNCQAGESQSLQRELAEMTKSISELANEKANLQSQTSAFEAQQSEYDKIVKELQEDKKELDVRVHELNNVLEQNTQSLSETLLEKTNESANLTKMLRASEETVKGLQEQVDCMNTQYQQLHNNMDEKENTVIHLQCQLTTLENQAADNTKLRLEIEQRQAEVELLRSHIQALSEEKIHLQTSYEIKEKELAMQIQVASELDRKVTVTFEQSTILSSQLKSLTEENQKLQHEVSRKGKSVSEFTKERSSLQEIISNLKMKHTENSKIIEGLLKDKEGLRVATEDLKVLEQNKQSTSESLLKKTNECSQLSRLLSERDETIRSLQECIDRINAQIDQLNNNMEEKDNTLTEQCVQIKSQQEKLLQIQETLSYLQEQNAALKSKLIENDNILLQKTDECSTLQKEIVLQRDSIHKLHGETESLREESLKLSHRLEEKEESLRHTTIDFQNHKDELNIRKKTVMSLSSQLGAMNENTTKLETEITELRNTLENHAAKNNKLRQEMGQKDHELVDLRDNMQLLNEQNVVFKTELQKRVTEASRSLEEMAVLRTENLTRDSQISKLTEQLNATCLNKESLTLMLHQKEDSLKHQEMCIKQLQVKLDEVGGQMSQKMEAVTELQNQVHGLQKSIIDRDASLQETEREMLLLKEKLTKDSKKFNIQLHSNVETITQLQSERTHLEDKNGKLSEKITDQERQLKQDVDDHFRIKTHVLELENVIIQLRSQVDSVTTESSLLNETLKEKEQAIVDNKSAASTVIETLRLKLRAKESECESLQGQLSNLQESVSKLNRTLHTQTSEITGLKKTIEERGAADLDQSMALQDMQKKIDEAALSKAQLIDSTELVSHLQSQIQTLSAGSTKLSMLVEDKHSALVNLQEKYTAQLEELQDVKKELSLKTEEIFCLSKALGDSKVAEQTAETAAEALRNESSFLHQKLQELQTINSRISKQHEDSLATHQRITSSLTAELERSQHLHVAAQKKLEQSEMTVHSINSQYTALMKIKEHLLTEIKRLEDTNKELKEQATLSNQEYKQQLDATLNEKTQLQNNIRTFNAERDEVSRRHNQQMQTMQEQMQLLMQKHSSTVNQEKIVANKDKLQIEEMRQKVDELQRAVQQAQSYRLQTEREICGYQSELSDLRSEQNRHQMECQALKEQLQAGEKRNRQPTKESMALVGQSAGSRDNVGELQTENVQLQQDLQHYLYNIQQRDLRVQQLHSEQGAVSMEVAPGAPQERSSAVISVDTLEASRRQARLVEVEQSLSQLNRSLAEETARREAAEEALAVAEERAKGPSRYPETQRDFSIQLETEEEWEALILNPNEPLVTRKMKGGLLACQRWLRGRRTYCSKLLTTRGRSRYFFLAYLLTLHLAVVMCLVGAF